MAKAKFEIPELQEYVDVPEIADGVMAHLSPFVAKPNHQTDLGFPGELVDDWHEKALARLDDLRGRYRGLQVYLDA